MTRAEVHTLQEWVVAEWWDEGDWDADVLFDIDPDGFWAILDDDGQVVGAAAVIAPVDDIGTVSYLYLTAQARGRGIVTRTIPDLFALLGHRMHEDVTVTVFMMPPSTTTAEQLGFVPLHEEIRLVLPPGPPMPAAKDVEIIDARDLPEAAVIDFDAAHAGRPRDILIRRWLRLPESAVLASVDDDGRLRGLGAIRPSARGHRVGPLHADDSVVAEGLLRSLIAHAGGTRVALDLPGSNPHGLAMLDRLGFVEEFRTVRMVWGRLPQVPWDRCYATVMLHLD